jgi:hypothetical protein
MLEDEIEKKNKKNSQKSWFLRTKVWNVFAFHYSLLQWNTMDF